MKSIYVISNRVAKISLVCLTIFLAFECRAQFSTGNITVYQAGDGSASLGNTGNPIVFKEYSPAGVQTYSMIVPSTSTNALVVSGSATSEGFLSQSADGKYLVFGGYVQSLPNATPLAGSTATTINRGIGMVGNAGLSSYSLVATSASFFSANNIRGAAATDNANCWGSGANQGTNYFGTASAPTNIQNTKVNLRAIAVFNNQLYASSQVASGTPTEVGVYAMGVGTSTAAGQTASTVINTGTGSQPAQFYFNNASTICYVADQRNAVGGGIQKWVYSSNTWTLAYTLPTGTTAVGATGVVADFSGANPIIYATTNESSSNRLISVIDAGALSTATTLATANTVNTVFRGLAFSPCAAPSLTPSSNTNFCANQTLSLNVVASGGGPYTYSWTGAGVFSSTTVASPTVGNASTGVYTISATNFCGISSATLAVNVNPLPALNVNSITICAGQTTSLVAAGAATYTWNTGSNTNSILVSPTANTQYTVSGTLAGCPGSSSNTANVSVIPSPTLTISGANTTCSNNPVVLTVLGAATYSWSNGSSSSSTTVSPLTTTVYTVTGLSANGCSNSSTTTITVSASPILTVSATSTLLCVGETVSISATGATTYSWSNGVSGSLAAVSPTSTTNYTVTGTIGTNCSSKKAISINVNACTNLSKETSDTFSEFMAFPNPALDYVTLAFDQSRNKEIGIINSMGQIIYSSATGEKESTISLKNYPKGIYVIQIKFGNEIRNKKLIID